MKMRRFTFGWARERLATFIFRPARQTVVNALSGLRYRPWASLKHTGYQSLKIVNIACLVHLFADHVGGIHQVTGPSMLPTMALSGEWVIESHLGSPQKFQRGDLAIYISPVEPGRRVCKRIIGLPGDIVCVDPTGLVAPSTEHVVVPKNHFWMSGDNAAFSRDSRTYGPVSISLVRGRMVARIWPWKDRTLFRNNFSIID